MFSDNQVRQFYPEPWPGKQEGSHPLQRRSIQIRVHNLPVESRRELVETVLKAPSLRLGFLDSFGSIFGHEPKAAIIFDGTLACQATQQEGTPSWWAADLHQEDEGSRPGCRAIGQIHT